MGGAFGHHSWDVRIKEVTRPVLVVGRNYAHYEISLTHDLEGADLGNYDGPLSLDFQTSHILTHSHCLRTFAIHEANRLHLNRDIRGPVLWYCHSPWRSVRTSGWHEPWSILCWHDGRNVQYDHGRRPSDEHSSGNYLCGYWLSPLPSTASRALAAMSAIQAESWNIFHLFCCIRASHVCLLMFPVPI